MSEREFVVINEEAARTAQNMMSFNEYQLGSRTKEYQEDVNEVYDLANIKRCQQRVDELKKTKEKGTSEADYGDFKVIENTELMRIQIVFDGKPDEAIRSTLKANGFRWAPSQGAWQRQLTSNGKCAMRRVIEDLGAEVQAS